MSAMDPAMLASSPGNIMRNRDSYADVLLRISMCDSRSVRRYAAGG